MLEFVLSELKNKDVEYSVKYKLSEKSTFKTGGYAPVAVFPGNTEEALYTLKLFPMDVPPTLL